MKLFSVLVFDEWVQGTSTYYTSSKLEDLLGSADEWGLQLVVDDVSTNVSMSVDLEDSSDGRLWTRRANVIDRVLQRTGQQNSTFESSRLVANARVRFALYLETAATVHARLYVCGRGSTPAVAGKPGEAGGCAARSPRECALNSSPGQSQSQKSSCGCASNSSPGQDRSQKSSCGCTSKGSLAQSPGQRVDALMNGTRTVPSSGTADSVARYAHMGGPNAQRTPPLLPDPASPSNVDSLSLGKFVNVFSACFDCVEEKKWSLLSGLKMCGAKHSWNEDPASWFTCVYNEFKEYEAYVKECKTFAMRP